MLSLIALSCSDLQDYTKRANRKRDVFYKLAAEYEKISAFNQIVLDLDNALKSVSILYNKDPKKSNYQREINRIITSAQINQLSFNGGRELKEGVNNLNRFGLHIQRSISYVKAQVEKWKNRFDANGNLKDEKNREAFEEFIKKANEFLDKYKEIQIEIEFKVKQHLKEIKIAILKDAFLLEGKDQINFKKIVSALRQAQNVNHEELIKDTRSLDLISNFIKSYRDLKATIAKITKPYNYEINNKLYDEIKSKMKVIISSVENYIAKVGNALLFSGVKSNDSRLLIFDDKGHLKLEEILKEHLIKDSYEAN